MALLFPNEILMIYIHIYINIYIYEKVSKSPSFKPKITNLMHEGLM